MTDQSAGGQAWVDAGRRAVIQRVIRGQGIEVGALHKPSPVSAAATVTYVDRIAKSEALAHYPELGPFADALVEPDIIDDGETLQTIADGSQDFVIASHFLEHCENPLGALRHHLRVLRPGGRLLLVVPNAADPAGFDHRRQLTSFAHLVRDDRDGPHVSRDAHYDEWVTIVDGLTASAAEQEKARLIGMGYSIHFHCWSPATFLPFLVEGLRHNASDALVTFYEAGTVEMLAVLARPGGEPVGVAAGAASEMEALRAHGRQFELECARLESEKGQLESEGRRLATELEVLRGSPVVRLREWLLRSPVFGEPSRLLVRVTKGRLYR